MNGVVKFVDNDDCARYGLVPWQRAMLALGDGLIDMPILLEDLNSVVFLCEQRPQTEGGSKITPVATGFFVRLIGETHPSFFWEYIVTARHVIEQSDRDTIYVRVNKKDRTGFIDHPTDRNNWRVHDNSDVAAIVSSIALPDELNNLDYNPIATERFVDGAPEYKYHGPPFGPNDTGLQVGIGDEIYSAGLLISRPGEMGTLPVARFGHVSQMPSLCSIPLSKDLLGGVNYMKTMAYMAEFVSWRGMSGSPVFWRPPMILGQSDVIIRKYFRGLLGLVSGHEHVREKIVNRFDRAPAYDDSHNLEVRLNSGIANIIPAEAIRELLMTPFFVEQRERSLRLSLENEA